MLGRRKDTVIRGFRLFDGIARLARDLKSYLWVADPRQVPFLCSCKEKEPKESTPRMAQHLPALRAFAVQVAQRGIPAPCATRGLPARAPSGWRAKACDARARH